MTSYNNAWIPTAEYKEATRLFQWMKKHGYTCYDDFHFKSIDDIEWFWEEVVKELDIEWYTPYKQVLDQTHGPMYPVWFEGGELNVAHLALDRWASHPSKENDIALYWEGDNGQTASYSFKDLQKEVDAVSYGLESYGITEGDIVTLYLPMLPETLIAMLAISKIGAIFSPAFSGYKADAVTTRIHASHSKALITADAFYRRGKTVLMKEEADLVADQCPSLEHVFVVERTGVEMEYKQPRDVRWSDLRKNKATYKTKVKKRMILLFSFTLLERRVYQKEQSILMQAFLLRLPLMLASAWMSQIKIRYSGTQIWGG